MKLFYTVGCLFLFSATPIFAQEQLSAEQLYSQAMKHLAADEKDAGAKKLQKLMVDHPGHVFAWRAYGDLADLLLQSGRADQALQVLKKGATNPAHPEKVQQRYRQSIQRILKNQKNQKGGQQPGNPIDRELKKHMDYLIAVLQQMNGMRIHKGFKKEVEVAKQLIAASQNGWKAKVHNHSAFHKGQKALQQIEQAMKNLQGQEAGELQVKKDKLLKAMGQIKPKLNTNPQFSKILKAMGQWIARNRPTLIKALQFREQFLTKELHKTRQLLGGLRPQGNPNSPQRPAPPQTQAQPPKQPQDPLKLLPPLQPTPGAPGNQQRFEELQRKLQELSRAVERLQKEKKAPGKKDNQAPDRDF
jgi:hypothetical protein